MESSKSITELPFTGDTVFILGNEVNISIFKEVIYSREPD